jgi:hypothetical protein
MSEQLRRVTEENKKLTEELEQAKTLMKTSDAARELLEYCKATPDPFSPEWAQDPQNPQNPWLEGAGGRKKKFLCF